MKWKRKKGKCREDLKTRCSISQPHHAWTWLFGVDIGLQSCRPKAADGGGKVIWLRIRTPAWASPANFSSRESQASTHKRHGCTKEALKLLQNLYFSEFLTTVKSSVSFLLAMWSGINSPALSEVTYSFKENLVNPNVQRWKEENEHWIPLSLKFLPRRLSSCGFEWII